MIRMNCYVDVFEPFQTTPYTIALKDASPSEEVTVMVHTGDHFNSCIASPIIAKRSSSLATDEEHLADLKKAKSNKKKEQSLLATMAANPPPPHPRPRPRPRPHHYRHL